MKIYLANPRGFCAGVDRAIDIVELSLKAYGAPIYVRHEIVHSRHVVNSLKLKGAVFVEELSEVPDGQTVIFSAHGVAKSVWEVAKRRGLKIIDATCPLVIKVHNEVNRDYTQGYELILIGHAGHPEVIGTPNSSNSNRLRELGEHCSVPSYLIDSSADINPAWLQGIKAVGISAGASAPEVLVTEVVEYLKAHGGEVVEEVTVVEEDVEFLLPKELISVAEIPWS